LLYHESDLRIEEHYTDTAGFTDHVFALCHLRGFRFAPRIRDLADKRLYVSDPDREYGTLAPLVGGRLHLKLITAQWEEVLRLAASIRHGTVTASLITCNNQRNTSSAKPTLRVARRGAPPRYRGKA
jgi:TnpA family transposase